MAQIARGTRNPAGNGARAQARAKPDAPSPVDLGPLADWIGFRLRMAQSASFQAFASQTQEFDLRPGRFAVLMLIGRNPGISQTLLSRANGRDKSTLTPALADLKKRGLIERRKVAGDRRTTGLHLTRRGTSVLAELTRRAAAHEQRLERLVGAKNKKQLMALLRRIATEPV